MNAETAGGHSLRGASKTELCPPPAITSSHPQSPFVRVHVVLTLTGRSNSILHKKQPTSDGAEFRPSSSMAAS